MRATLPILSNTSCWGVSAGESAAPRRLQETGVSTRSLTRGPRASVWRIAERSLTRLLMTKISRAELTISRSLRALAIAQ
jgi:hypothetical protein